MERNTKLKKVKRQRKLGFLTLMKSHGGQKVIKRRRDKKRKRVTI